MPRTLGVPESRSWYLWSPLVWGLPLPLQSCCLQLAFLQQWTSLSLCWLISYHFFGWRKIIMMGIENTPHWFTGVLKESDKVTEVSRFDLSMYSISLIRVIMSVWHVRINQHDQHVSDHHHHHHQQQQQQWHLWQIAPQWVWLNQHSASSHL